MVKPISEMIVDGIGKFYTQFKSQRILKSKDAVLANTNPDNLSSAIVVKELYNNLKQTFQAGVDTLYNRCVSCGATPSAKTPTAVSTAISTIHTNRYNDGYSAGNVAGYNTGRTQGQNDVKGNPNAYGLYSKAQYDAGLNWISYTSPGASFSYNLGFNPRILLVLYDSGSGSGFNIFAYYDSINNITAGSTPYCARTANGFNWNYGSAGRPVKIGYRQ